MPCHIIFHIFPLSLIKSSYLAPGEGPPSLIIWTPCTRHPAVPGPAPGIIVPKMPCFSHFATFLD